MAIKTLTIADTTSGLALNADGYTLTVTPGASTDGIVMNAGVPASSIGANLALGANQTWTNNSADALTVSGAVSGAFALTKAGAGTLTMTGANTYTGATTINGGTLTIGGAGQLGAGAYAASITNNGAFVYSSSAAQTLSGTISGAGTITQNGPGALTLSGANSYSGQTSVAGGTLNFSAANNLGDGSGTNTISLSGGAQLVQTGGAALNLGANRGIAVGAGGGMIAHNNAVAAAITVSGNLTGTAPLSFQSLAAGGGTFILSGNNSGYTGDIAVGAQSTGQTTLQIASTAAAPGGGSITLNYPASGATGTRTFLSLQGASLPSAVTLNMTSFNNGGISLRTQVTSTGAASVDGPITVSGDNLVEFLPNTGSTLTVNGNTTVNGAFTGTMFIRGSGNGVVNGTITIPSGKFAKTDAGSWTVTSTGNSWATSQVAVGTLKIGAPDALATTAPLTMGQGDTNAATFDLGGFNQTVGGLVSNVGASGVRQITNTSGTLSTLTIDTELTTQSYGSGAVAIIAGNLAIVKKGTGTQTLLGTNTFTGGTTVSNGTLVAQTTAASTNSLSSGAAGIAGIATLQINNLQTSGTTAIDNTFTGSGRVIVNFAAGTTARNTGITGVSGFNGTIELANAGANGDKWNLSSAGVNAPGATVQVDSGSTMYFPGGTTTFAGVTVAGAGNSENRGALRFSGSSILNGPVTLSGNATIASDSASTPPPLVTGDISVTGAYTLTVGHTSAAGNLTMSGVLGDGSGTLSLTKTTAGVLTLTGASTYTGATTISAGTLRLGDGASGNDGTIANTSGVTNNGTLVYNRFGSTTAGYAIGGAGAVVKTGPGTQTLSGANTYTGATTVNAGTLTLDYSLQDNSKLSDTAALILSGAALNLTGGTHTEIVASTTLTAGVSSVTRALGAAVLAMGAITTSGGLVNFGAGSIATTTNSNDAGGILGVWATVGSDWAGNDGSGNIVAYTGGYTDIAARGPASTISDGPASNVRILGDGTSGHIELGADDVTVNSLWQVNADYAATVNTAGKTLQIGGIRINSGSEALTIGASAGDGTLSVATAGGSLFLVNAGADKTLTVNAAIADNSTSALIATGNVTLNGANAYAGATTITNGTLKIGSAGSLGSGAYAGNIANNGTLQYSSSADQTLWGAISGPGALTKDTGSSSTLTLSGPNTYTGNTTVSAGNLTISGTGYLYGASGSSIGTVTVAAGAGITLSGAATNNVLGFGANAAWVVSGTIDSTGGSAQTLPKNVTLNNGTLTGIASTGDNAQYGTFYSGTSNSTITANGATNTISADNVGMGSSSTLTLNTPLAGDALSVSSVLGTTAQIAGALTKTGLGTVTIAGANTYTGATTVSEGALNLTGNRTAAATGGFNVGNVPGSTGTLNVSNGTFTVGTTGSNFLIGSATGATGIMNQSGGSLTTIGNQLLIGNGGGTGTYNLSGGTLTTIAGSLGVTVGVNTGSTAAFNLSDSGVLSMPATSTLQITRSDNSAASGVTGTFTQTGGTATVGILQMGGSNTTPANNANATATLDLSGGTFTVTTFNQLSGANNSTSTINISGMADVTLPAFPTARGAGSAATITFDGGTLRPAAASATYMGGLTNAFIKAGGAHFDVPSGRDITIAQALLTDTVSTGGGLTKDGAGTLTLTGANTYTGDTIISDGVLTISNPYLYDASTVTISIVGGLNLAFANSSVIDLVADLWLGGVQATPGTTYDKDNTVYITGTGKIMVAGIAGDTNSDNVVDAADFITLKKNFGTNTGSGVSAGDFNASGTVNWADLGILMSNMGTGGAPATAPEPATLGLLAIGGLALLRRRRA
jgi:autotransporter-associated beta strand protein